ncbi:hypothetical protein PENSPDRAFT_679689 [Peniophora sp. CONT]|nr:hypothetical protein PENSPDRAFT_679689 [Peniophora sp. CONT]
MSYPMPTRTLSEFHEMQWNALHSNRFWRPASTVLPQLPPEILTRIFEFLREVYPHIIRERSLFYDQRPIYLGWPVVSHVCKHWRSVCLGHRALWTMFTPELAARRSAWNTFIERSGKAPLVIEIPTTHKDSALYEPYVQLLTSQLSRIQSLRHQTSHFTPLPFIDLDDVGHVKRPPILEVCTLLDKPAPMMRELVLNGNQSTLEEHEQSVVISRFLSSYVTHLGFLDLRGFSPACFPWTTPPTSLRTLRLVTYGNDRTFPYAFAELLDGLCGMPNLEELLLCSVVPTLPQSEPVGGYRSAMLRRLRRLSLTGIGEQLFFLWASITPSSRCFVDISASFDVAGLDSLCSALNTHVASSDIYSLSHLIVRPSSSSLSLAALSNDEDDLPTRPFRSQKETHEFMHPGIRLNLMWGEPEDEPALASTALAVELLSIIPLSSVTRLKIDASRRLWVDAKLLPFLGRQLVALESLSLEYCHDTIVTSALSLLTKMVISEDTGNETPLFPHLRSIFFSDCRFIQSTIDALAGALQSRSRLGYQIMDVNVQRCTIKNWMWIIGLNLWKPSIIGRRVEWDEVMESEESMYWN